jgi:tetratricopeptide (TPR) repeat protein
LEKLDPQNLEAEVLKSEVNQLIQMEQEQKTRDQQLSTEAQSRFKHLMSMAGLATDNKRYDEAKTLYRQILAIDPSQTVAKENLAMIERKLGELANAKQSQQAMQSKIAEQYTQGMLAYNSGNILQAAHYLRPLLNQRGFEHSQTVRNTMNDINEKLKVEIAEKLTEVNASMDNARLLEARKILDDVLLGSPEHQEALKLKGQLQHEIREQARELFREGYTLEQLVHDISSAKERYQKVLEMLPDRDEEYHQKAQSRLQRLN